MLGVILSAILILARPETIQYLFDIVLKAQNISYSHMEGSLLSGVRIHNVNYQDAVMIKTLHVNYSIQKMLSTLPNIDYVSADHITIIVEKLPEKSHDETQTALPPFIIETLSLKHITVIMDETFTFNFNASKLHISSMLTIEKLSLDLQSAYADITMEGAIKANTLYANVALSPTDKLLNISDLYLYDLPKIVDLNLTADTENIALSTQHEALSFTADENLSLADAILNLNYHINHNYFTFKTAYTLNYNSFESRIEQEGLFTLEGAYSSKIHGKFTQIDLHLPFQTFSADTAGDVEAMVLKINAGSLQFFAESEDYAHYSLHSTAEALSLSFYPELPDIFQNNIIAYEASATLELSPFSIKGDLYTEGNNTYLNGDFDISNQSMLYKALFHPKTDAALFEDFPIEKFSPIQVIFYGHESYDLLNIDAASLNFTLFKNRSALNGWGNLASATFNSIGTIKENGDINLSINSSTPSLYALASELIDFELDPYEFYDAQVEINTTVNLGDTLKIQGSVNLPWYVGQLDSQTHYYGEDLFFGASADEEQLQLDRYRLDILQHTLYSERASKFVIDEHGTIHLESFWIFDNLLLTGSFNPLTQHGLLHLSSDDFHYQGTEGNITTEIDITALFDENLTQTIEGTVYILDGSITYAPHNNYAILDEDIIIIQDVKAPSKTSRTINIGISSAIPITYKYENIEIKLTPDFTIYQEPFKPLLLLGMVHIDEGEIKAGNKRFEVQESDIYLQGDSPLNPYLNLHLLYTTIDYIDIDIVVANTLNAPVILFSSSPPMSQHDILSYLLFGGSAASTFESSGSESTTASVGAMLLGTGLKTIFTDTTGVQVDTLNILTNKEGSLGYEIGARFSKEIRLVYKNDTISSIILQYSLSKSIRIDVDVHETGQGINLLYIKDF